MAIELFKDKKGYVIRKGILRIGCYVDKLTEKELLQIARKIIKKFGSKEWCEVCKAEFYVK